MAAQKIHISRFTPSLMEPETLEAIFVQRQRLATDTLERIRESALHDNKHYMLLIGPRGCGKTHFVSLIYHRVKALHGLDDKLRIAWLNEDKMSTSVLDLNRRIYERLSQNYPNEFPAEPLQKIYELNPTEAAKYLKKLLNDRLKGKSALVIIENLDTLFEAIKTQGQHEWRSFLQESGKFCLLATAQQLFLGISDRNQPFYGFFQTTYFKPLNLAEGQKLLSNIAQQQKDDKLAAFLQTPEGRSRVRALHHLSGGNHRVYVVFAEFINRQSLDELVTPFEKMLDELTPYYQERLRWLAPQQRMIVEYLCTHDLPLTVKSIARALFTTSQTISRQLKELKEKRYVRSAQRGRESLYELTEPLMRLSMELKENRGEPIRLIVDFLRIWYSRKELDSRLGKYEEAMESVAESLRLQPQNSHANCIRAEILLSSGRWQEGWAEATKCLQKFPPQKVPTESELTFIQIILNSTQQHNVWVERITRLCELFDDVNALNHLGEGLVRSLKLPEIEQATSDLLNRWQSAWHQAGDQYAALSLSLRLFDVGIEYLKTREPNALLGLPIEQRAILEQLFNASLEMPQ